MKTAGAILFFDGVCNLCNRLVIFIIKHDRNSAISFATLQSDIAKAYLGQHNLTGTDIESVVFLVPPDYFLKSAAILHLFKTIGGGWRFLFFLIIIPKFIRDYIYDVIARNRYRIFGRSESCMVPSAEISERFL
jgi:predicted DCC family thiol-disulfide oxidoreductase YuxK